MKKAELIKNLAEQTGNSQKAIGEILSALELTLINNAAAGEETYVGHLTVSVGAKPPRVGRNPKTGASVQIPARSVIKVKVGKALKDAANGVKK